MHAIIYTVWSLIFPSYSASDFKIERSFGLNPENRRCGIVGVSCIFFLVHFYTYKLNYMIKYMIIYNYGKYSGVSQPRNVDLTNGWFMRLARSLEYWSSFSVTIYGYPMFRLSSFRSFRTSISNFPEIYSSCKGWLLDGKFLWAREFFPSWFELRWKRCNRFGVVILIDGQYKDSYGSESYSTSFWTLYPQLKIIDLRKLSGTLLGFLRSWASHSARVYKIVVQFRL